jgi:putative transposase
MGTKRHKPEDVVAKLRQADVLIAQGQSVAEVIRALGVTEVTYYRWRKEFGGLKTDQVRRMKDLEIENQRLRKAIADLTLDKLILQEAARGRRLEPRAPSCPVSSTSSARRRIDTAQGAAGQR